MPEGITREMRPTRGKEVERPNRQETVVKNFQQAFSELENEPDASLSPTDRLTRESIRQAKEKTLDQGRDSFVNTFENIDNPGGNFSQIEGIPVDGLIDFLRNKADLLPKGDKERIRLLRLSSALNRNSKGYSEIQGRGGISKRLNRIRQEAYFIYTSDQKSGDDVADFLKASEALNKRRELIIPPRKRSSVKHRTPPPTLKIDERYEYAYGSSSSSPTTHSSEGGTAPESSPVAEVVTVAALAHAEAPIVADAKPAIDSTRPPSSEEAAAIAALEEKVEEERTAAEASESSSEPTSPSEPPTETEPEEVATEPEPTEGEEAEEPPLPPDPEPEPEIIDAVVINATEKIRKMSSVQVEQTLQEEMRRGSLLNPRDLFRKIKLRVGEEWFRQRWSQKATELLRRSNNSFAELDITKDAIKDANRLIADEKLEEEASVKSVLEGRDQGAVTKEVSGELKTSFINEVVNPFLASPDLQRGQIQEKLTEFIQNHSEDPIIKEVFGSDATKYGVMADYFASNLEGMVAKIRSGIDAHKYSLDQIDQVLNLRFANMSFAHETEVRFNTADKIVALAQKTGRGWALNPATVGAVASLAGFAVAGTRGAVIAGPLAGAVAAGIRRSRDLKIDRAITQIEVQAYGGKVPQEAKRREALNRYGYDAVSINSLLDGGSERSSLAGDSRGLNELTTLDLTQQNNRDAVMRRMAEITMRMDYGRREHKDLITYQGAEKVQRGRLELSLAMERAKNALKAAGMEDSDISTSEGKFRGEWEARFIDNVQAQDRGFRNFRYRSMAGSAAFGGVAGLAGGMVLQQGIAEAVRHIGGHETAPTVLESMLGGLKPQSPPQEFSPGIKTEDITGTELKDRLLPSGYKIDFTNDGNASILSPDGERVITDLSVENGNLLGNTELTDDMEEALRDAGLSYTETPPSTSEAKVLGPNGEWERLATDVDRRKWFGYDTGKNVENELRLFTRKEGDTLVLNMSKMGEAFDKGTNVNVQDLIRNHKSGFAFTLPGHGGEPIWIPDGADGAWDGKLHLDPNSTRLVEMPNGEKVTLGQLSKMIVDQDALSQYKDGGIATQAKHRTEVFRLGLNGERGRIEASALAEGKRGATLQVFATIRGSGEVLDTIQTTETPGGFKIEIPENPPVNPPPVEPPPVEPPPVEPPPIVNPGAGSEVPFIATPFSPRYPLERVEENQETVRETGIPPEAQTPTEQANINIEAMFAGISAEVTKDHEYFVENPPTEIALTSEQMNELELLEPFFIELNVEDGRMSFNTNSGVVPFVWDPKIGMLPGQENPRFAQAEALTNGDSGLLALAAVSSETPEKQARLYKALSKAVVAVHLNNPDLVQKWLVAQGAERLQSEDVRSLESIDAFMSYDMTPEGRLRPEAERLVLFDATDQQKNNELLNQTWRTRIQELQAAITSGNVEQRHLRWIEFLSHSVNVAKLVELAKEQQVIIPTGETPEAKKPPTMDELFISLQQERNRQINYDKAYVDRFERAKKEAIEKGIDYNYPPGSGTGWKLHLNIPVDSNNPTTQKVAQFVFDSGFDYKIGQGGYEEDGKGMTIYVGDRDTATEFSRALSERFIDELGPAKGESLQEEEIAKNVRARFEAFSFSRRNDLGLPPLHQYGSRGVSYLDEDMSRLLPWSDAPEGASIYAARRADAVLRKAFGAFYTGTGDRSFVLADISTPVSEEVISHFTPLSEDVSSLVGITSPTYDPLHVNGLSEARKNMDGWKSALRISKEDESSRKRVTEDERLSAERVAADQKANEGSAPEEGLAPPLPSEQLNTSTAPENLVDQPPSVQEEVSQETPTSDLSSALADFETYHQQLMTAVSNEEKNKLWAQMREDENQIVYLTGDKSAFDKYYSALTAERSFRKRYDVNSLEPSDQRLFAILSERLTNSKAELLRLFTAKTSSPDSPVSSSPTTPPTPTDVTNAPEPATSEPSASKRRGGFLRGLGYGARGVYYAIRSRPSKKQ